MAPLASGERLQGVTVKLKVSGTDLALRKSSCRAKWSKISSTSVTSDKDLKIYRNVSTETFRSRRDVCVCDSARKGAGGAARTPLPFRSSDR